jgi:hypothetical protein
MFVSLIIPAIMLFSVSALYIIERKVVMGKRFAKADILDVSQHFKCDVSYHLARSDF